MVRFRPFNAYLPRLKEGDSILDRVSPPFDAIEEPELTRLRNKPYNVTRISLGGLNGNYEKASKELADWILKRILVKDEKESYYLYRQSFTVGEKRCSRTGLIGLLGLEEYGEGRVIPHEETNPKVKEDRLNLLRATSTHTESIFGLIDDWGECAPDTIEKSTQKLFELKDDTDTMHSISRVSDPDVTSDIANTLMKRRLLIADGHHRYETALEYSKETPEIESRRWVLATLVSSNDPGVVVFPTHRLLKVPKMREDHAVETMRSCFLVERIGDFDALEPSLRRTNGPSLGVIFRSGNVYKAELASYDRNDPMWQIDSHVFQEVMLRKVLHSIARPGDLEIEYDHDSSSVSRKMESGAYDMSVFLRPPNLETIWRLAVAGRRMPKKTTYFWPKIWSGFVFHRMT
jgi:uncharacterized protein (DUF1015 family)